MFSGHSGPVTCGSFTPDGKGVVTGGGEGDASLRLWNPKTGECTLTVQVCVAMVGCWRGGGRLGLLVGTGRWDAAHLC